MNKTEEIIKVAIEGNYPKGEIETNNDGTWYTEIGNITNVKHQFSYAEQDAGELIKTEQDKRQWINAKKRWLEEIEGYLVSIWPSTSAAEKKNKTDALEHAFNTRSWSAIEMMSPELLEDGYARVREFAQAKIAEAKGELPQQVHHF